MKKKIIREKENFMSRCTPNCFATIVAKMSNEQIMVARELGFSKLMDMNCEGCKKNFGDGWLIWWTF